MSWVELGVMGYLAGGVVATLVVEHLTPSQDWQDRVFAAVLGVLWPALVVGALYFAGTDAGEED